ncbi:pleckstrin homology domain-containing family O member 2 isoform X2 [Marmota marmota marmota]|uniref:pleckstrin homology domain-containing family O member 2 isoform X2 n=1 Tax=Marmota marmota marmota TaxID=9994 RepID=UPI002092AB83|nr:pleckstrin homology domain-containing family O member 2 isoform X2 [Marmota marmota marmota]
MEEEGLKEGSEKPRGARTADKAGWIKKSSGGLLGLWKDRYLLLCQAQLLVYENEDEQKCVETVELGSYEKCQDLRALLKRKHRFILLRSPGNKVKVDKTCVLEHVTRDRVRGGQRRRPPTRIHLKEVANAASDGFLRLDLDVPDSGPPVFVPSNDVSAVQPRETPQPLMPPTKPSPALEKTSLSDKVEPPSGDRAPTPVSASSEAQPESQEDSEILLGEDSGSKEPPNSILPDKLKVSWESPSLKELPVLESAELSKVSCSETAEASPRGGKPPTPPPKILSEKMKACLSGMETSEPAQSSGTAGSSAPGSAQFSVNGVDDGPEPKPSQGAGAPGTAREDATTSTALPPWDLPPQFHPRCSSLGDLLGEGSRHPRLPREQLYRAQLEVKIASEQTEKLLNKVLGSEPPPVSAETLLSQAVEQLRQATQVLQEMKDLGDLSQEAPGLKEKRKELVTLYRRSAP